MNGNQITLDETIEFLNGLLALDSNATNQMIHQRVLCNKALSDHPSVRS